MIADLKPYPAMKDSSVPWLGEVPEHWSTRRLRAVARSPITNGVGESAQAFREDWPRYVRITDIAGTRSLRDKTRASLPPEIAADAALRPGDLLLAAVGATYGKSYLHRDNSGPACFAGYLVRVAPNKDVVPEFLSYWTESPYYWNQVNSQVIQATIQNFSAARVKGLRVPFPPLPEQAAIVRFLDHADRRIRRYIGAKQKLIKLLEEQKQAIIHRAVTLSLDPNVRLKHSGVEWLGDVPEHWEVVTLQRVIRRAVDGPHHSPGYVDRGVPFLSARNIKADRWSLEDAKFISEADYQEFCRRVVPEIGDVLYTKGGTTGVARAVDLTFRFQVWVHVAVLKVVKSKVLPAFLAVSLNSPRCYEQSQLFTRGATNQDLGLGRMKGIFLALPPVTEQAAILAYLSDSTRRITEAIDRARRECSLVREYRTRLIADVVTGKLDVREAAGQLPVEAEEPEPLDEDDALTDAEEDAADDLDGVPEEAEA
jgi:type I restriction enzyme S subunit